MDHTDAAKSIKQMARMTIDLLAGQRYAEAVITLQAIQARADDLLTPDEPGKRE